MITVPSTKTGGRIVSNRRSAPSLAMCGDMVTSSNQTARGSLPGSVAKTTFPKATQQTPQRLPSLEHTKQSQPSQSKHPGPQETTCVSETMSGTNWCDQSAAINPSTTKTRQSMPIVGKRPILQRKISAPDGSSDPIAAHRRLSRPSSAPSLPRTDDSSSSTRKRYSELAEKFEFQGTKLRFINARARKLREARPKPEGFEARQMLQESFEDVYSAVKASGPAFRLVIEPSAKHASATGGPRHARPAPENANRSKVAALFQRQLSKIRAQSTFQSMSACREDFRRTCDALGLFCDDDGAVNVGVGEELDTSGRGGDGSKGSVVRRRLNSMSETSTIDDSDPTAPRAISEELEWSNRIEA